MSISNKQLDKILTSHDQAMKALATADKKKTAELKSQFADLDDLLGRMAKKHGQDGDIIADALAEIAKKDAKRAARLSKIVGSSKKKDEVEKFNPYHDTEEVTMQSLIDDLTIDSEDVINTLIAMGMPADEAYFTVKLERGEDPQELTVDFKDNENEEE